jgi:hypothetical protein
MALHVAYQGSFLIRKTWKPQKPAFAWKMAQAALSLSGMRFVKPWPDSAESLLERVIEHYESR